MIVPLEPNLKGAAAKRFLAFARHLVDRQLVHDIHGISSLVESEVSQSTDLLELQGQEFEYEACVRVLGDLANLRWRLIDDGYGLELHSPQFQNRRVKGNESIQQYKKTIRDELRARIDEQFSSSSVRRFIRNAEQPPSMKKRKSILNLIADGHEVQKRLELARSFSKDNPNRLDKLRTAIKPYLQLVEPDVSDEFTNIPLLDIWRYFRYSWSIPQTPIPGRHLNYLVRDAAQESHAVIGIIGLSNCVVQLTPRDRAIGWTSTSLQQAITAIVRNDESTSDSSQRVKCVFDCLRSSLEFNTSHDLDRSSSLLNGIVDWLLDEVSTGIEEIESRGLLTESEILNPTREVIARLKALSREFATNRQDSLAGGSRDHKKSIETEIPLDNDLIALDSSQLSNDSGLTSRRMLIGKKRALELSKLLDSRRVLTQKRDVLVDPQRVIGDILDDEVQTAINSAMASIKSRRIGTNMLEITTCGAVTPYNTMLGGKLVALLTLSPQVSVDYQRKYGSEPTIIRSQLKNRTVVPDSKLVWLSTTSLFAHGSSQYERLRLPAGVISRDQSEIRFDYIGDTAGYGTIQFADETVRSLERVLRIRRGYRDVNGVFGEGASPRRRKLRLGLDAVGIQADVTMLHHQKRRIYAIPLFKDAAAYLCGLTPDVPDYLAKPEIYCDASERIIEFWRSRWLSSRLTHDKSWQTLGSTRKWTLSSMLPDSSPVKSNSHGEPDMRAMKSHREQRSGSGNSGAGDGRERLSFWRRLAAAGSNSVSEGLSDEEFKSLHLKTGLEDYLVQRANETTSIVLTGNAGDGKTHLARVLRERLGDAAKRFDFIFDATAMMTKEDEVDPIIERWHRAQESGAGIVLAINHYPLHMLRRKIAGELPAISEDLDRQWRQRLVVDGDRSESEDSSILLVDLSLRNVLQRDFAKRVFEKILNDSAVEEYANSEHDINFSFNYQHLKHPEVQERLLMLLNRLISSGIRASVRELWILASRLLFGVDGEDTAQGALEAWYSERLFEEDSRFPLVAAMCTIADPSKVSHLHVDSYIENRKAWKSRDWLVDDEIPDGLPLSALTVSPKNIEENQRRFPALKRRYYFEHQHGGKRVFELDRSADARFHTILNDRGNDLEYLGELIEGINRCYFPQQFEGIREKLCLWVGHRLDEQPTKSFVASEYIPRERLEILRPCPPRSIQKALQYSPDHIVLRVSGEPESDQSNNETLRIDATLFRTLISVAEGMPRHLINAGEMNRLDAFIDHLKQLRPPSLLEILIYNSEQALASSIKVSSDLRRYLDIHPV